MKPKRLMSKRHREMARRIRDGQWAFLERLANQGPVWVCTWNKIRRAEQADELRLCLISGMELLDWMQNHQDWFVVGEWSEERYAQLVTITEAGRTALVERAKWDMEPVTWGLVQPGWVTTPSATHSPNVTPPGAQTLK